ncbi:sporulation protein YpjB [Anoxybacillus tepidamans]|uniref:Sporulation protein YpjB n=1 Tax=Anoxybacteroides tepidamans TaxID=265948 RepID=A0A7W8MV63_9BACL|nr:sporulation protein YpjB [Anoxybacillus tepidamans]MBB5323385.1 sporulation protein YpjB [Anoxybacillus tepidamans]
MRQIAVLLIIIIVYVFPSAVYATYHDGWQRLDKISDEALQLAKNKRFEEAKEVLDYFANEFFKLNARERLQSMDELRAITVTHEKALKTITASTLPAEERIDQVAQFRLVIDAVHSNYQPLWTEMEQSVMEAFHQVEKTVKQGNSRQFQIALAKFLHQYEIIEPSVKIDVKPDWAKKADADIAQLQTPQFQALTQAEKVQVLAQMKEDMQALFDHVKKDEADPSLWWVMISTGGMIVATLIYVGWRKYRGEKQKTRSHEKQ